MIFSIFSFFILGFIFGFLFDLDTLFIKSLNNKFIRFVFDFTLCVIYGLAFFTMLLIFNDGVFRGIYFISMLLGFTVYMITLYKLFNKPRKKLCFFIRNLHINLKISNPNPKYFKKVLHSSK